VSVRDDVSLLQRKRILRGVRAAHGSAWAVWLPLLLVALLTGAPVAAQPVTIGATQFPHGEDAFPDAAACVTVETGCGGNKLLLGPPPGYIPVSFPNALLGHRLDLVALDIDNNDEILLEFPIPILNRPGPDIYLGQAQFTPGGGLDGFGEIKPVDVQVRFDPAGAWHTVARTGFMVDASVHYVMRTVFYGDPEIKSDTYTLWMIHLDLSDLGFAPDQGITQLRIRGGLGAKADLVLVGSLNARPAGNQAPIANAGPDQSVTVGVTVELDGSGSSDADGDALTYEWTLLATPGGSAASLLDATTATPSLMLDQPGDYDIQLIVRDQFGRGQPDVVRISTSNRAPVADAGPDQRAQVGGRVTLDSSASIEPDGHLITRVWSFVARPADSTATLSDPTAVRPWFVADLEGDYELELVVTDTFGASATDRVVVSTSTSNAPPVAEAGPDQSVPPGMTTTVTLDGSASRDPDLDPLSYQWTFIAIPPGSSAALSQIDPANPQATFAVDLDGDYVVQLVVSDGTTTSAADTVLVTTGNVAPVAIAGADQDVSAGSTVALDGSASVDANVADTLSYWWALITVPLGSTTALAASTGPLASFVADQVGEYVAQLFVSDGAVLGAADTVLITATNAPPVADAGPDQNAFVGMPVTLDSRGSSDPDGGALVRTWTFLTQPAGSTAQLSDAGADQPSFVPDRVGLYELELLVTDTFGAGATDRVVVEATVAPNVPPVAADQSVTTNEDAAVAITLAASDANGDALTYAVMSGPSHGTLTGTPPGLTYTPAANFHGADSFTFRASDGQADSNVATASITVNPVNDVPSFTAGDNQTVTQPAGAQTVPGWATAISPGPADEAGQTVTFLVSSSDTALFSAQPAVSPTGTLTYTPATGASGVATLSVQVQDSGGTANGGVDTSAVQTRTITVTAAPVSDLIFQDDFDSGTLAAWSGVEDAEGDLSVIGGALAALIDNNTPMWVRDDTPANEVRYRARFYLTPNSIPMASGNTFSILAVRSGDVNAGVDVARIDFRRKSTLYEVRAFIRNDAGKYTGTSWYAIPNGPTSLEIDWQASTSATAKNGSLGFWIGGVLRQTLSRIDNDTLRVDSVRLGPLSAIPSATRGTVYFDGFVSRRTTYIGP
jgi:hypothetical protein